MDINFTAPANFMGYGLVGLNLLKGMVENGNSVAFWPLPNTQSVEAHTDNHQLIKDAVKRQETYNPKAPSVRHWHQFDMAQHIGSGLRVGSTVFELTKLTEREIHHLNSQDALAVPSKWAHQVLLDNGVDKPTVILPHGVDRNIFNENVKPGIPELRQNNTTVFVNIGKWEIRKGHDVLVEAFNRAFEQKDNVHLVMACYNPFYSPEENKTWEDIYKNSKLGNKITVMPDRLALQQDVAALMACGDCFVSPARAEGFNLENLEALSMGLHLITTNYAGHTEYANDKNSLLINPGPLELAFDGKWFNGEVGSWASIEDEQIEQIVSYMRLIHSKKQYGELLSNLEGIKTAIEFSWNLPSKRLTDFLKNIV